MTTTEVPPATKRAHEVTCAFLCRWSSVAASGRRGLWYFDIERQEIRFSTDASRHPLATERYLYMPLQNGRRDASIERWFATIEGGFIAFLQRVDAGPLAARPSPLQVAQTVLCAVSFGYRSGFDVHGITRLLTQDAVFRKLFGDFPLADAHRLAIENLSNSIWSEWENYRKLTVLTEMVAPLLVCDHPLLALEGGQQAFLPVGPFSQFVFERAANSGGFLLEFATADEMSTNLAEKLNRFTVERARKWVVARDERQLEALRPQLTLELVSERRRRDRVQYTPFGRSRGTSLWELES